MAERVAPAPEGAGQTIHGTADDRARDPTGQGACPPAAAPRSGGLDATDHGRTLLTEPSMALSALSARIGLFHVVPLGGTFDSLPKSALLFATAAHAAKGQRRRYTGEPYVAHSIAVAEIVKSVPHDAAMVAAALLHDVLEDTQVPYGLIEEVFGRDVAQLVLAVSKMLPKRSSASGSRAERAAFYRAELADAPPRAQTIKVADIIDNVSTIRDRDPDFARLYLPEKRADLDVLTAADPTLLARAHALVSC